MAKFKELELDPFIKDFLKDQLSYVHTKIALDSFIKYKRFKIIDIKNKNYSEEQILNICDQTNKIIETIENYLGTYLYQAFLYETEESTDYFIKKYFSLYLKNNKNLSPKHFILFMCNDDDLNELKCDLINIGSYYK